MRQREEKQAHEGTPPGCFVFCFVFFFHFPSRGESAQHTGLKKASDKHRPNTPLNKYN